MDQDEFDADMFREFLLDHYQNPRNKGRVNPADIEYEGDNPSCGDRIVVTAALAEATIDDVKFEGTGCAISQAAASILYEDVIGMTLDDVMALERRDVEQRIGMTLRPARVKCGVLGLNALKHGILAHLDEKRGAGRKPPGFRAATPD